MACSCSFCGWSGGLLLGCLSCCRDDRLRVYTSVCTVVAVPSCIRRLSWFRWFGVETCDKTLNVSHGADTIWNTVCWTSVVEPAVIHFPHCIVIVARIEWIKIPSFYPVLTPSANVWLINRKAWTIVNVNVLQVCVHFALSGPSGVTRARSISWSFLRLG